MTLGRGRPQHQEPPLRSNLSIFGIAAVAGLFLAAQLLLFDESRFLSWDEAVYVGKSSDRFTTPAWGAHRALGMPWLLKPAFWFSESLVWMRWYLAILSTLLIAAGFAAWRRTADWAAPLGMALFCSSWLVLIYGSEASPNLFGAACALGAVGLLVDFGVHQQRWALLGAGCLLAVTAVLRPSDAIVLAATLGLAGLVAARSTWRQWVPAIAAGLVLGMVPWLLDAILNFGGPIERWQSASDLVSSGFAWRVGDHARLLDGPLRGPDRSGATPRGPVVFVLGWLLFASLTAAWHRRLPAVIALGAALLAAFPYLTYIGAQAPRFLFPAYAFLALAVGFGAVELGRRWLKPTVLVVGTAFVVGLVGSVDLVEALREGGNRGVAPEVGAELEELADSRPCVVLTSYSVPQMTILTGCRAERLAADRAGCQVAVHRDSDVAVLVSAFREIPEQLVPALLDEPIVGPGSWRIGEVDPQLVECVEAGQAVDLDG